MCQIHPNAPPVHQWIGWVLKPLNPQLFFVQVSFSSVGPSNPGQRRSLLDSNKDTTTTTNNNDNDRQTQQRVVVEHEKKSCGKSEQIKNIIDPYLLKLICKAMRERTVRVRSGAKQITQQQQTTQQHSSGSAVTGGSRRTRQRRSFNSTIIIYKKAKSTTGTDW